MRRPRNPCIYTGRVGRKMSPPRVVRTRRISRRMVFCLNGPLAGYRLCMDASGGFNTLPLVIAGTAGHYADGTWVPFN